MCTKCTQKIYKTSMAKEGQKYGKIPANKAFQGN